MIRSFCFSKTVRSCFLFTCMHEKRNQKQKQYEFLLSIFYGIVFCLCTSGVCASVCTKLKRCFFISSFIWSEPHHISFCISRIAVSASSKYNIKLSYRISKIYDTHVHARFREKKRENKNSKILKRIEIVSYAICSPLFSLARCDKSIFRNKFKWNICTIISFGFLYFGTASMIPARISLVDVVRIEF